MPGILYDLKYLDSGLEALEAYLLADDLYWPVGASALAGEPDFPSLTLGGLFLAQKRLAASSLAGEQLRSYQDVVQKLEAVRQSWRVAWERKARRSFHARLNQWRNFLVDYSDHPEEHASRYPYEVRVRVMLALLQPEAGSIEEAELELLASLDQLVRARLQPGAFIWEAALSHAFPPDGFWFLYGTLKANDTR